MKIELWSDYVCPFCYIGKKRLEIAIEQLNLKDEITVELKSYELDPYFDKNVELKTYDYLKTKYNMSEEKVVEMTRGIEKQAEELGLKYDFANMKQQNTFDAHRLVKFAEDAGKGPEMSERLLQAYFTESKEISKPDVLKELAEEIGLDIDETARVLCLNNYTKQVKDDIQVAKEIGVQGVPFFVFGEKYAISGAQPLEVFIEVIEKVQAENKNKPKIQKINPEGSASYCTGDGCNS